MFMIPIYAWCITDKEKKNKKKHLRKLMPKIEFIEPTATKNINFSHQTRLFPINLHSLMEGWKGRGNEEEEGEEAIILIITVDTFLHQKEVKVHIKRAACSFPRQLSLSPVANGPETRENLIGRKKGKRE